MNPLCCVNVYFLLMCPVKIFDSPYQFTESFISLSIHLFSVLLKMFVLLLFHFCVGKFIGAFCRHYPYMYRSSYECRNVNIIADAGVTAALGM